MGLSGTGWMHNCERHGNPVLQHKTRALGELGRDISGALTDDCFPPDAERDPVGKEEYAGGRKFNSPYEGRSLIPFIVGSIKNAVNGTGSIIDFSEEEGMAVPSDPSTGNVVDYREPDPIAPLPDGERA